MAKIDPLSGFPEFLPAGRIVERSVIDALASTFELHGFANIETRVVEPLERLAKGGEIDKEIYLLNRLSADGAAGPDDASRSALGMHFDLTVPLARYVVENAGRLTFPFRRYQIQPAWRGERPQEGRFRQFTQADVDIIGVDHLPFHHDVEVVTVMVEALARLPLPPLTLCFNNRKLIQGYLEGIGVEDIASTLKMLDKLDKVDRSEVVRLLVEQVGLDGATAERCLALATIRSADESFVEQVRALGVTSELLDTGLEELRAVISALPVGDHGERAGRRRPADRAGPRLLHGDRRRDLHGGVRAPQGRGRRWAVRRPRDRREDHLPRGRHLVRGVAQRRPARGEGCSPAPSGAQRRARRARLGGGAAPASTSPGGCAPGGSRARSPRRRPRSASRSASPTAAASRSWRSRGSRWRAPGEGHPLRGAGGPRPGVVDPTRRATCDRRWSPATEARRGRRAPAPGGSDTDARWGPWQQGRAQVRDGDDGAGLASALHQVARLDLRHPPVGVVPDDALAPVGRGQGQRGAPDALEGQLRHGDVPREGVLDKGWKSLRSGFPLIFGPTSSKVPVIPAPSPLCLDRLCVELRE